MLLVGGLLQTLLPIQIGLIASSIFTIAVVAYGFRALTAGDFEFPGFEKMGVSAIDLGAIIATAAVLGLFANITAALIAELIPALAQSREVYEEAIDALLNPDSVWLAGLAIFSITIVAPVCEEYLFRGTILPAQLEHESEFRAVAINGILFGMIHFNPLALVSLSIVGAYFAHITSRSRALWPAIIAHAALNAVNGVLMPYVSERVGPAELEEPTLQQLLVGFVVLGVVVIMLWRLSVRRISTSRA